MGTSAVAAAGLLLDIVGAVVLASAIFLRRARQALEEATPKYNFNAELHASLSRQTADAQAGLFLLVVGFGGQYLSAVGWSPTGPWAWGLSMYVALVTVLSVLLFSFEYLRPRYVRMALFEQLQRSDLNIWWIVLRAYGNQLRKHRQPWADLGRSLLGAEKWGLLTLGRELPDSLTQPGHEDTVRDQNDFRAFQG